MKKLFFGKTILLLSALSLPELTSCRFSFSFVSPSDSEGSTSSTSDTHSSTSDAPSSTGSKTPSSSGSGVSSSSSRSTNGAQLILGLGKNEIPYGLSFLSGCKPTVSYVTPSNALSYDINSSTLSYLIAAGGTSYNAKELLPQGQYTVSVYSTDSKIYSNSLNFTVEEANIQTASEGHGYTYPDLSNNRLECHENLSALAQHPMGSKGTKKVLVVPVYFTGGVSFTSQELQTINNAYNGAASSTGWQSLSSFYKTASYGALDIEATITPAYCDPRSESEFQKAVANYQTYSQATAALANTILSSLASSYNLSDFDSNGDGYLDGLEMVYKGTKTWDTVPNSETAVWWNYTSFSSEGAGTSASPKTGLYFWSQYSLLANGYYSTNIDCHTLIHETGHMLGLDDYYSYDREGAPAGLADMMDWNVGDHNAYSKMLLGWVKPKVLDGTLSNLSITLSSFTTTGDCLLLRNSTTDPWNGTPFDEYLLLQYYTPTGLNEYDAQGYPEWKNAGRGGLYEKAGLQVFHVDSRICDSQGNFVDNITTDSWIPESNTPSMSVDIPASVQAAKIVFGSSFKKIKALPATGKDIFMNSKFYRYFGDQSILFGTSDYGCGSSFYDPYSMSALFVNGTTFDDGTTLPYCFSVTEQNDSQITIHLVQA